ncbi:energy transducer TonB [Qipengyuania aquimaris]|uniref:energy transducer TonB n=1 Tax=Qipengyuania aquimaris TaxID=255984 RepID=UPI001CD45FFB|nr:energy transducer TonB [Qipengyuania aquimaris]MCA0904385.1 energy transducer TonB [Qipengyuania aquimaris]
MYKFITLLAVTVSAPVMAQESDIVPPVRTLPMEPAEKAQPTENPANWVTTEDYPNWAERSGSQGRVVTELVIEKTGRVSACRITVSSDIPDLDRIACAKLMQRGRFKPARDEKGIPIASRYEQAVRFVLPGAKSLPRERRFILEYVVDRDGSVIECRVEGLPEDVKKDPCDARPTFEPPRADDGTPEQRRYRQSHIVERLPLSDED